MSRDDGTTRKVQSQLKITCLSGSGYSEKLQLGQNPWGSPDGHFLHFQK